MEDSNENEEDIFRDVVIIGRKTYKGWHCTNRNSQNNISKLTFRNGDRKINAVVPGSSGEDGLLICWIYIKEKIDNE